MNGLNGAYVESMIKEAISGKFTTGHAATKLGVTKQYVNKLKRAYAERGSSAFGHGNRGKPPKWKTDPETERRILSLYGGNCAGFKLALWSLQAFYLEDRISIAMSKTLFVSGASWARSSLSA